MWSLVVLTGFSYEEMYGRFAGTKKSGRNNEVVVRRGSTLPVLYSTNLFSREIILDTFRFTVVDKWNFIYR